jgi:hypothetical protein
MSTRGRLRSAAVLTALSILLSAAGAFAWTTGWPSWEDPGPLIRAGLVLAGHLCFAVAATMTLLALRPFSGRWPWVFLTGLCVALPALQLVVAVFSASFEAADEGVPAGPLARLALPALAVALAGFATAIGALMLTLNRALGAWRPVLAGMLGAGPAAYLFVFPLQAIWLPVALGVWLTVGFTRRAQATAGAKATAAPDAARLVGPLAAAGLGMVMLVWAVGAWVGIATAGTETATTAMGVAAGAAQLAAVPVFLSAALLLRSTGRQGAPTRPLSLILTAAGLAAGAAIALVGMSPDGGALYLGSAISGGALGLWLAFVVASVVPGTPVRIVVAIGAVVAAEVVWFLLVPLTGGVALGAIAVALLLTRRRPAARFSPARAAASP